ncbi:acyl-CoA thioesterase [candidate division CSSED10-310 bacterium]|uniref:Acyl-CoA thioesterase n=1 Tax=candidate division CSSED10-310 bacterium TaxID=2855610 RepID=A0ABV6Z643_UNCC1
MSQSSDFKFGFDFRVRYAETDAQGIVHNSNYLLYFELGRVEYLRSLEFDYASCIQQGFDFLLAASHVEYRSPATFDQLLYLQVCVWWVKRSSFQFRYQLADKRSGNIIAEGYTTHVTLDLKTRTSSPFPEELKRKIMGLEQRILTFEVGID